MAPLSQLVDPFTQGFQNGSSIYNAMAQAPLQRKLLAAQAQNAEEQANQGKADMIDYGMIDPKLAGHKGPMTNALPFLLAKKTAQAGMGMPVGLKLSPDQIWDAPSQSVKIVPGSKTFLAQKDKYAKDKNTRAEADMILKKGESDIDFMLDPTRQDEFKNVFGKSTYLGSGFLPGKTQDMQGKLQSIKSSLKMQGKSLMSRGGSIGAMTVAEWPYVESLIESLNTNMTEEGARDRLTEIKARMDRMNQMAGDAYTNEWGGSQFEQSPITSNMDERSEYQKLKEARGQ